ncbi:hypothetical protein HZ994_00920 [Akkermansiaceae bacterium]|nr:hypothetical protein HZ994_00920 [Akkermansiaceae bacterium]
MNHLILPLSILGGLVAQADVLTSTQRFFGLGGQVPNYSGEDGQTKASALDQAPYSPADSDLGVQEILVERPDREPVIFDFHRSVMFTDTAPSGNPATDRSSWVFGSSAAAAWRPHISRGWFADLGAGVDILRYDRTNAVDFENFTARLGVFRIFPELDDTILFTRLEFQRITSTSLSEGDYNAQRIRTGLQKVLWSMPRHQLVGTVSGAYEWSARPEALMRNEYAAELAYSYSITDSIYTVLSARASRFNFDQFGRDDWTYRMAAELVWQFTERLSANASLSFDKNQSDTFGNFNEYEAWSGGLGIGMQLTF